MKTKIVESGIGEWHTYTVIGPGGGELGEFESWISAERFIAREVERRAWNSIEGAEVRATDLEIRTNVNVN